MRKFPGGGGGGKKKKTNPVKTLRYVFPNSLKKTLKKTKAKRQTVMIAIVHGTPSISRRPISRYLKSPTYHLGLSEQVNFAQRFRKPVQNWSIWTTFGP